MVQLLRISAQSGLQVPALGAKLVNSRTPVQEVSIDAAIAHLDFLLQARRNALLSGGHGAPYRAPIHSAVIAAAMTIIDEPQGQVRPVRRLSLVHSS